MVRVDVRVPVDEVAPAGVKALGGRVVVDPAALGDQRPIALCCFPGGGMSARYFDLGAPGGPYDMAAHLAAQGFVLVLVDHPGVGTSDAPDDGWSLTTDVVTDVDAEAARHLLAGLRSGTLVDGLPALPDLAAIGVGHSMGGMLVAFQQARHRLYDGVALLGHSGRGLPEVLTPDELAVTGDAERVRSSVVALAQARFADARPRGTTWDSEFLVGPGLAPDGLEAISTAADAMLAIPGLASMLSGSQDPDLAAIDVPVLLALAEHDIVGPPHEAPRWMTGSRDVTLHVLAGAFHNSNLAERRHELWDRIGTWARTVGSSLV